MTEALQRMIDGKDQVRRRIDQRAVDIEDNRRATHVHSREDP
ncbi:MAG: hypothetical protein WDN31_21475 [Hyphomicrobium sp.]